MEIICMKLFHRNLATLILCFLFIQVKCLLKAGTYPVNFDATGLASGIYFYQLQANGVNLVKKMNLMK